MTDLNDAALVIVDVQNDFCPGGSLAVAEGDQVVEPLNACAAAFARAGRPIYLSRDWHPPTTAHFIEQGGVWPVHCVQGTSGAAFHPALRPPAGAVVLSKGMDPGEDGCSAFVARDERGVRLAELLTAAGVRHVYVGGLATDYCVKATAIEAAEHGFAVTLLHDACRAVELQPGDGAAALAAIAQAGAELADSGSVTGEGEQGK